MRKKFFFLGILLGVCLASPAQFYSARTNLIGLATGNINLEGSMTLNRRWSLHLPVQYNPFVFKDNRQFRNLTVMPGVRYWFVESYSNFFVGMNTLASGLHRTRHAIPFPKKSPGRTVREWNILSPWPNVTALRVKR